MIPYFRFTTIPLGPFTIQVWGLLVSLGILVGILFGYRLGKKQGVPTSTLLDATLWGVAGGILGARLFHIVLYDFSFYVHNPGEILKFWHGGASSLGGFVGASVGVALFLFKKKISWKTFLPSLDIGVMSLWLGWGIGRIGCFLIHDHPGTLSHFMLAVNYPGGARHDLGLYDSVLGFSIFIISFCLYKTKLVKIGSGKLAQFSILLYAFVRFWLDFLRATDLTGSDVRYLWLTPAQWGMLVVVGGLTYVLFFGKKSITLTQERV
jgi:phosphatidylglycerol:prolipoprotein diacylglycerol transferase